MTILAIGVACVDLSFQIQEPLEENKKYSCMDPGISAGGPAFNAAYVCALWGHPTMLISRIGQDEYGTYLRKICKQVQLDLTYCPSDADITTPYSFVLNQLQNGSRTIFNFPCKKEITSFSLPQEDVQVILSDGHLPKYTRKALHRFPNAISILDADTCRRDTLQVCPYIDYLICSEEFAQDYLKEKLALNHPKRLEEQFIKLNQLNGKHLIITIGDQGCLYRKGNEIVRFPSYRTQVVDTCGAGDIFHGAFAYCVANKISFDETLRIASMSSSIAVSRKGSHASIPKKEEVMAAFKQREV